jgi:ketosteroid isomerase-like protein
MRRFLPLFGILFLFLGTISGCSSQPGSINPLQRAMIERLIEDRVKVAYDFSQPDFVGRLMDLYAQDTRVLSASGGQVIQSRDSLKMGIMAFWENVGKNMRDPKIEWTSIDVDVLSPTAAVMTATYRIPHKQPNGLPHTIVGAWTAVFERRGERWGIIQEHLSDRPY